jgi:hypothetical protein
MDLGKKIVKFTKISGIVIVDGPWLLVPNNNIH